jgi:hypothetical protein
MKWVKRVVLSLAALVAIAWIADYAGLRLRSRQFGQVEVHHRYAVQLRNKQIEQMSEKPYSEECVYSLFPHFGDSPCWYLRRNADSTETLDGRPWHFWAE